MFNLTVKQLIVRVSMTTISERLFGKLAQLKLANNIQPWFGKESIHFRRSDSLRQRDWMMNLRYPYVVGMTSGDIPHSGMVFSEHVCRHVQGAATATTSAMAQGTQTFPNRKNEVVTQEIFRFEAAMLGCTLQVVTGM